MKEKSMAGWKTTKIPPQLHLILKREAANAGISLGDLLELLLIDWARRQGLKTPPPRRQIPTTPDIFLVGGTNSAEE